MVSPVPRLRYRTRDSSPIPPTIAETRLEERKEKWFGYRAMRTPNRALVLCALALGACKQPSTDQAQQPSGGSTAATVPSGSEILIGATLPLTGSEARIGGFYKEGYDLAFEEANQNGRVSHGGQEKTVLVAPPLDTHHAGHPAWPAASLDRADQGQYLRGTDTRP